MAEKESKTDDNTSGGGTDSAAGGGGDSGNNNDAPKTSTDTPVANATTNAATDTGNSSGGQHSEEQARSLSAEEKQEEPLIAKTPFDAVKEAIKNFAASFPLRPETMAEVRNGLTGYAMAGIQLTEDMVKNTVKAVDPLAHAVGEAIKQGQLPNFLMAHVDNSHSAQLPSQAQGKMTDRAFGIPS